MIPVLEQKPQKIGASRVITLPEMTFTDWGKEEITRLQVLKNKYQGKRKIPLLNKLVYAQLAALGLIGLGPTAWTPTIGALPAQTRGYFCTVNMNITGASAYKVALFLSTSNLTTTSTLYSALTNELSSTNTGYTTGGIAITFTQSGTTTITTTYTAASVVWTAGSATIVCRYAVIYQVAGSYILCYCTLDSAPADITIATGNTLTINPNASGVFTLG